MSSDDRAQIERLLKIHRRNLATLETQAASYGGEINAPLHTVNQLDSTREQIKSLEERLAALTGGSTGINISGSQGATVNNSGTVAGRDVVNSDGPTPQPTTATPNQIPNPRGQEQPNALQLTMDFDSTGTVPRITMRAMPILNLSRVDFTPPYDDKTLPVMVRALDYAQGGEQQFSPQEVALLESLQLWANGDVAPDVHQRVGRAIYMALGNNGRGGLESVRNYSVAQGLPINYILRFPRESVNLAALPWEALWDDDQAVLLARGSDVDSVERYMDIERALPPPVPPGQRLRLLALSPQSRIPEDVRAAERAARQASWDKLRDAGVVSYDEISPLTVRALSDYIRNADAPPDIIHYYGHGLYQNGQGYLEFDDGAGEAVLINAQRLAALLGNVRLIVLEACQTGMVTQTGGLLTGVAPALSIVTGAVVAMQLSVRVEAATRFSEVFYDELLRKRRSLQQAVAEARQTLYFEEADGASWYVPTLYIRGREQKQLFLTQ